MKVVQGMLGRSSASVTLDTYSHVFPALSEQLTQGMETALLLIVIPSERFLAPLHPEGRTSRSWGRWAPLLPGKVHTTLRHEWTVAVLSWQLCPMIGRCHHVVIDCPDPAALAEFYSVLIGLPITYQSDDWVVISQSTTSSGFAFQRVTIHRPPRWPDPEHPQQFHLDVMVDELAQAEREVPR